VGVAATGSGVGFFAVSTGFLAAEESDWPLATDLPLFPDPFFFSVGALSSPGFSSGATALADSAGGGTAGFVASAGGASIPPLSHQ
jgi:hypothetical protein